MNMPCLLVVVDAVHPAQTGNPCIVETSVALRTIGYSLGQICSASEHMRSEGRSESGFARLPHRGVFLKLKSLRRV
jgi:hypothetical protein